MNFASDNATGVAPQILDALAKANEGSAIGYGADAISDGLTAKFRDLFETEVAVYPVATGTAANSLSMSILSPPYGAIYCLEGSHMNEDECGAPEFYTGGAKLVTMHGENGKVVPGELDATIYPPSPAPDVHRVQPAAVSITQASEIGTVYSLSETAAVAEVAHRRGVPLHMDGARFANAVAALDCTPAEATWKAGVDILSFGATKNGAMAVEAVVLFGETRKLERELGFRRKRGAHLFSKMRYLSAQLDAYIEDGLWLDMARHANAEARRLADGLKAVPGVEILFPVEANMMFATLPAGMADRLAEAGYVFYRWGDAERPSIRLVTAWNTEPKEVDGFIKTARAQAKAA